MHRIDTPTAVSQRPAVEPPGEQGWFTGGDPVTGQQATHLSPDFVNDIMDNILYPIEAAGIIPAKGRAEDLYDAIVKIVAAAASPYVLLADDKPQSTHGGTFAAGSWLTRTLNVKPVDTHGLAALSGNVITLPSGTWRFSISAPALDAGAHQARLWNITTGVAAAYGTSEKSSTPNGATTAQSRSVIAGQVVLTGDTQFRVEHRCLVSGWFGQNANVGPERFTIAEFWRLNA